MEVEWRLHQFGVHAPRYQQTGRDLEGLQRRLHPRYRPHLLELEAALETEAVGESVEDWALQDLN